MDKTETTKHPEAGQAQAGDVEEVVEQLECLDDEKATLILTSYGDRRYREGLTAAAVAQCVHCRDGLPLDANTSEGVFHLGDARWRPVCRAGQIRALREPDLVPGEVRP